MSEASEIVVRDLRPADEATVTRIFAASFVGFPVLRVMVGDESGAHEKLERLFAMEFEPGSRLRIIVAVLDGQVAGALTYADSPHCAATSTGRAIRVLRITGPRILSTMRMNTRIDRAHPRSRHRHLPTNGVDPSLQGRGIGRQLMMEFDRRCDADGIAGYLETIRWADTGKPSLERFYQRLGYEVVDVLPMTDDWAVLTMRRASGPRAAVPGAGS